MKHRSKPESYKQTVHHPLKANGLRVIFADDHKVMRQELIRLVESQPDIQVVGEAADGREATIPTNRRGAECPVHSLH